MDADPKLAELVLAAVRRAVAEPGEHRLFRAGKLPGLFAAKAGPPADAARRALADGHLEVVRTEARGKLVTEWVRATPAGVELVHDTDSPKVALADLRAVLTDLRAGVPGWLADVRRQVADLDAQVDRRSADLLSRLDALADRLDAALRRYESSAPGPAAAVPWATTALAYLDRRSAAGAGGACPLAELFRAVRSTAPDLTLPDFHAGLRRLHDGRAVRLTADGPPGASPDPEYATVVGAEVCGFAER